MAMVLSGEKVRGFLKLLRVKNLLIICFTQYLVYYSLLLPYGIPLALDAFHFFLLVLSTVLIAGGGYVINDYMDVKTDEINHGKVVVGTLIKRRTAIAWHLWLTGVGIAIGLYLTWYLGLWYLAIFHLFPAWFLWFYSATLKRKFLVGNLMVSAFISGVVITVAMHQILPVLQSEYIESQRNLFLIICGYALFAFIANLIREIIKDLEDVPGDSAQGFRTMAILFGETGTKVILSALIAALVIMVGIASYKVLWTETGPLVYTLTLVVLPAVLLLYQVVTATDTRDYHKASTLTKVIMLFGIVSMFAFNYLSAI